MDITTIGIIAAIIILAGLGALKASGAVSDGTGVYQPSGKNAYDDLFQKYGAAYNIDWMLIKAVCWQESSFNPNAINPSDPSYGLMQIQHNPNGWSTALAYGKKLNINFSKLPDDLYNPELSIRIGGAFIAEIVKKYGNQAIDIYNIGETSYNRGNRNRIYRDSVLNKYNELITKGSYIL